MPANPWIASLADAFINNALSALGAGARAMENPGEFLRDDLPEGTDDVTLWIQDRNRRACRRHARNEAAGLYSNLGALPGPGMDTVPPTWIQSMKGQHLAVAMALLILVGSVPYSIKSFLRLMRSENLMVRWLTHRQIFRSLMALS